MVFALVCSYTAMHINQNLEISLCLRTHFHLIAALVHLLASVHADHTCRAYMCACVWSSTSGCQKNWCQYVSCQTRNCARNYYIYIYLMDLLLRLSCKFCCCCARILLVAILRMLNSPLLPPPAACATIEVGDLTTPKGQGPPTLQ